MRTSTEERDQEKSVKIRQKARAFAQKTVEAQRKEFQSWGVIGNWSNPYITMSKEYVKNELIRFFEMYEKGFIFQRYMPVYWSPVTKTALAEAELEYNPSHKSTSVYVR